MMPTSVESGLDRQTEGYRAHRTTNLSDLKTERSVEQKLVYPFLVHPSFMGIPAEWVRTMEYMEPTDIDIRCDINNLFVQTCLHYAMTQFDPLAVEVHLHPMASRKRQHHVW